MQQKISTRERIVTAAKQLFAERGFHGTAMADLAEHAQVSVGAIYRTFPGKSEIIRAIVLSDTGQNLGRLQAEIDSIAAGTVTGAVAIERLVAEWVSKRSEALNHEIVAEAHRNSGLADAIAEACGQYREQFRVLARLMQPDLSDVEIEGAAELFLACFFGMGNRDFTRPRLDEKTTATTVARLILRGLGHDANGGSSQRRPGG